jgi:predicted transposase/invertase (TIGR01784 family)
MARYLDPKNDLTFKRIFGEHPKLLIDFLNALMLLPPARQIKTIEYLSPEQVPENPAKKYSIVDVKCKDKSGRIFIVEMQMYWLDDFKKRVVFNAGKALVRQLLKGDDYDKLRTVYSLAILNEAFDRKTEEFYHHYHIVNPKNTDETLDGLEFILIELSKFKSGKWAERKTASLWLRFLNEVGEEMRSLPQEFQDYGPIREAVELCETGAYTQEQLDAYDKYWDIIRIEKALKKAGHAEGLAEGLVQGEAIGLEKGREEGEVISMEKAAINSHKAGIPIDTISTITGLTAEQITEILKRQGWI